MAFAYSSADERADFLEAADAVMRSMNDEYRIETWLMCGVPDGATREDYLYIARDEGLFWGCARTFTNLMRTDFGGFCF